MITLSGVTDQVAAARLAPRATSGAESAIERQLPRVYCHAHHRVHAGGVEAIDLVPRSDASGRRDAPARRRADGEDRLHVGALHQPLAVDMGVEELAAERL